MSSNDLPTLPGPGFGSGSAPPINTRPTDSTADRTIGVAVFCMVMGIIAVATRLYTRTCIMRRVGVDDGMAVLSLVFLVALAIAQVNNVKSGLGTHIYLLDFTVPASRIAFFRDLFFTVVFYNIALLFIKLTFLFQYYRIVAQVRSLRWGYILAMFLIGGWTVAQIFVTIFTCTPIHKSWDFTVKGTCLRDPRLADINAIGNIVSDFIVLVLPLPVLFRLKLPRPQKFALVGIFCLGFMTCIISMVRRAVANFTDDITFSSAPVSSFSIAEVASGIVCAALPTLRPLLSRCFPTLTGTFNKLGGNQNDVIEREYIPEYKEDTSNSIVDTPRRPTVFESLKKLKERITHAIHAYSPWATRFRPLKSPDLASLHSETHEKNNGNFSPDVRGFISQGNFIRHGEQPRKPVPPPGHLPFQQHMAQKPSGGSLIPPSTSGGMSTRSQLHKSLPPLPPPSPLGPPSPQPLPFRGFASTKTIGGKETAISWPVEALVTSPPPTALAPPPRSRGGNAR